MSYDLLTRTSFLSASLSIVLASCGHTPLPSNRPSALPAIVPSSTVNSTTGDIPPVTTGFALAPFKGFSDDIATQMADSFTTVKFDEFDKDKDGGWSATELESYLSVIPAFLFGSQPFQVKQTQLSSGAELIKKYDKNNNKILNVSEFKVLLHDLLSKTVLFDFVNVKTTHCHDAFTEFVTPDGIIKSQETVAFFKEKLGITLLNNADHTLSGLGIYLKSVTDIAVCGPRPPTTPTVSPPISSPAPAPTSSQPPIPTGTPTSATADISTLEKTTFNGKVYDDTSAALDGTRITATSLNATVSFVAETTTIGGAYAFNNAPAGVQIEIRATKAGFTTRKRVEVLKSNKQGDPNANKYDFGTDGATGGSGSVNNALSDKPEVIAVTPSRNASGVALRTSLILKFNEPMDKKTIEETISVRAFNARKLSVDNGKTTQTAMNCLGNTIFYTVCGDSQISTTTNNLIWDKSAFNIAWNSDDTEVTLVFKNETYLPSDKDTDRVPDYQVVFSDTAGSAGRLIKDKPGNSRFNNHFKLTEGPFEESYKFTIQPDEVKPRISSLRIQTDENQGNNGDAIKVVFNKRMILYTKVRTIAGGGDDMDGSSAQKAPAGYPGAINATNRQVAKNYSISVIPMGNTTTTYVGTWFALGGQVVYDSEDPTHKTVLLLPTQKTDATVLTNGIYLNTLKATTIAATGAIALTATDNVSLNVDFVKPDGSKVVGGTDSDIADAIRDASAAAQKLQTDLNIQAAGAAGASGNPFTVTTSVDNKSLIVTMNDTSGTYIGWTVNTFTRTTEDGIMPGALPTGRSFVQGRFLNIYHPGDTIRVVVSSTILDPAGNTLDTSRDNFSDNAS